MLSDKTTRSLTFAVLHILRGDDESETLSWLPSQLHVEPSEPAGADAAVPLQTHRGHCPDAGVVLQPRAEPLFGFHGQRDGDGLQEAGALDQSRAAGGGRRRRAEGGAWHREDLREQGAVGAGRWRRWAEQRRWEPPDGARGHG